ncbi:HERC4 ligase, partial [Nothoprocta ornata]|nr:HERC4 ligase [Nothoprocta pentlandii]NWY05739.1 HERC4 ligase [Nothoprocta ornata]
RKEYVDLYVNYMLNKSVQKPFEDFKRGFSRGCPTKTWKIFLPEEIQTVLEGHVNYDWHHLEKNVQYINYQKSDRTIKNFWNVFHRLPEEKKKMFLAFLSGSDRIPATGMPYFVFYIADPNKEDPDAWYPFSNTCSLVLSLPR